MGKIARISKDQGASRSIGCMSSSSPVNQIRLGTSTSPDGGKLIARANWWQSTKIHQHVFTWQWTLSVLSKEEMLLKLPNGSMALLQPWDYNNLGPPPFPHHNVQLLRNPHVWNLTEQQSQFLDWGPSKLSNSSVESWNYFCRNLWHALVKGTNFGWHSERAYGLG